MEFDPYDILKTLAIKTNRFIIVNAPSDELSVETYKEASYELQTYSFRLRTGLLSGGYSLLWHKRAIFNPRWSQSWIRIQFLQSKDFFAFVGFKETSLPPSYDMVQSHIGIMAYDGKLYLSSADGSYQQRIEVYPASLTKDRVYLINRNEIWRYEPPEPRETISAGELPAEFWQGHMKLKFLGKLNVYEVRDQFHYFVAYIESLRNVNCELELKFFMHASKYAD